jgi:hypothetical protein
MKIRSLFRMNYIPQGVLDHSLSFYAWDTKLNGSIGWWGHDMRRSFWSVHPQLVLEHLSGLVEDA